MLSRRSWLVLASTLGFICLIATPARSATVLVVGAIGCYLLLRSAGKKHSAPIASPYSPDVQYAVDVLSDEKKFLDLVDVLNLFVRRRDQRGRYVRYVPTLLSLEPTVFGASAQLLAVDGQEANDFRKSAGRLATALMVASVVVSEPHLECSSSTCVCLIRWTVLWSGNR
jgi:hypothetical protein